MIQRAFITQWGTVVPWSSPRLVEQDLIICRALVSIYDDPFLKEHLAFRGGTALHKLYLQPQPRYSEDIDLVQLVPGPIKPVFERLQSVLDWLPGRSTEQTRTSNKMKFRYLSEVEPQVPMRLKIEINCVEHRTVLGTETKPFSVESDWFSGRCDIPVFRLPELLGTKFNALYGRKKIRDLFDLDYALRKADVDVGALLRCWRAYREGACEPKVGRRAIVSNLEAKLADPDYFSDMENFLAPGVAFDPRAAWANVKSRIVDRI